MSDDHKLKLLDERRIEFGYEVMRPQVHPFVRWLRLAVVVAVVTTMLTAAQILAIAEMLR